MEVPEYKISWIRKNIPTEAKKALLCRKLKRALLTCLLVIAASGGVNSGAGGLHRTSLQRYLREPTELPSQQAGSKRRTVENKSEAAVLQGM